jgi:hypothetical protein
MTVQEFQQLAEPQTPSTTKHLTALQQITTEAPWFADAQVLLLKVMKQQNMPDFVERFPFVSLYATHREMLSAYLRSVVVNDIHAAPPRRHSNNNAIDISDL